MGVVLDAVDQLGFAKRVEDHLIRIGDASACEWAEPIDVVAVAVNRHDDVESILLRKLVVFRAAPRRDVDNAGAFFLAHVLPRDHLGEEVLLDR